MSKIKGKDTSPELTVRKLVYSLGYRYRLHDKKLPGKPDLVFRGRKKVIFVHGCFWHYHNCKKGKPPKSNESYWLPKLERNKLRDLENTAQLEKLGWGIMIIWQCQLKDQQELEIAVKNFLES